MSGVKGRSGGARKGTGPKQSELNIWLQEQMIKHLGSTQAQVIIEEARIYGNKRYVYMIGRLDTYGLTNIGKEYNQRKNTDQRERFARDKKRHLALYRQQLDECKDVQRGIWLRRRIQKIEDYLKKTECND